MKKEIFIKRILELDMELKYAIYMDEYEDIEKISIKIGKLVVRYLGDRKLLVDK